MAEDHKLPTELQLDYVKAQTFKDIFVDGVFGGITPRGYIQMAVYNERFSIPKTSFINVQPDGTAGEEIMEKRVTRSDVVRDLEANLIMDVSLARSIASWLIEKADTLEAAQNQRAQQNNVNEKAN